MINNKSISAFLLASSLLTGLSLNIDSASAATLASCLVPTGFAGGFFGSNPGTALGDYLFNQGSNEETFEENCDVTDIGKVDGRAGASRATDYEVGIGLNGAQADLADQLELDWVDESVYSWTLTWNPDTNIATFNVEGDEIDYDFDLSDSPTKNLDKFNAFGILARADDESTYIDAGTAITITVDEVIIDPLNGNSSVTQDPNISFTATSDTDTNTSTTVKNFYTINAGATQLNSVNSEITSMSGTFAMDIPTGGKHPQEDRPFARSRIGFQLLLFDPPVSVAEPASISSLLTLGAIGFGSIRQKKKKKS